MISFFNAAFSSHLSIYFAVSPLWVFGSLCWSGLDWPCVGRGDMVTLALLSALYPFAAFGVTPLGSKTATRFSVFVRLRERIWGGGGCEDARMPGRGNCAI